MLDAIDRLVAEVEEGWAVSGHARPALPAVAAEALGRLPPLDVDALARSLFPSPGAQGLPPLPPQRRLDGGFGQPSLTLHHGDRLVVEALCWVDGSPAIHQHAFSGAFRLMAGRSAHTCYAFEEQRRVDDRVLLGDLRLLRSEWLEPGAVRPIPEGPTFIHAAFHLDVPSMTIVVRTHESDEPEHTYLPPGLALDPAARTPGLHARLQLLDTLDRCGSDAYLPSVRAAVADPDLYAALLAVLRAARHDLDLDGYTSLVDLLVECHGPDAEPCRAALREAHRRDRLTLLRRARHDPTERFFLACLLNHLSRGPLLAAMARHHGDLQAARHALGTGVTWLLGLHPRARGIVTEALGALLDGTPPAAFAAVAANRREDGGPALDEAELQSLCHGLRSHPLLAPLWVP